MIVDGHEIDQDSVRLITGWIREQRQPFERMAVMGMFRNHGVPWEKCDRAADRLLQFERRHGSVKPGAGRGMWEPARGAFA